MIDQGPAPQLIALLYCNGPQWLETSSWPGTGESIAVTLTLVEEICGFDLCLKEGRLDLQNCRDNGSSSSHLPSVSDCNLKAVGVGLCPDCRPNTWPRGVYHVGLAGGRRNKIQINLLQITTKCRRITLILECWIYTSTGIQWLLQKPLYHRTWRVSSVKADENWLSINSSLPLVDRNVLLKPQLETSWIFCFLSPVLDKTTNPGVVIDTQTCWISRALHKLSLCQPDQGTLDLQEKNLSKCTCTSFSLPYYLLFSFVLS